jgi:hypothetical protein
MIEGARERVKVRGRIKDWASGQVLLVTFPGYVSQALTVS